MRPGRKRRSPASQVVDLPEPRPLEVTGHRAHARCCGHCGTVTRAAFPDGVSAPVRYGLRIAGVAVCLQHAHFLPEDRQFPRENSPNRWYWRRALCSRRGRAGHPDRSGSLRHNTGERPWPTGSSSPVAPARPAPDPSPPRSGATGSRRADSGAAFGPPPAVSALRYGAGGRSFAKMSAAMLSDTRTAESCTESFARWA